MRVTIAQLEVGPDHAANRAVVTEALVEAERAHADLLVVPEYASGYDPRGVGIEHAEPLDGPFVTLLRERTGRSGLTVVAGTVLPSAGSDAPRGPHGAAKASNAVVVVRGGAVVGIYRKVHLYDAFGHRESDRLTAGDPEAAAVVVQVGNLRVGVMTCYDLRFPETARRLVDAGAHVIVVPAAWARGAQKVEQWRILAQARALENTCAVVAVGQAGRGVTGHSMLVEPDGVVALELGDESEVRSVDIDLDSILAERERNPSLVNRRYGVVPLPWTSD